LEWICIQGAAGKGITYMSLLAADMALLWQLWQLCQLVANISFTQAMLQ
jgi:hypothetical protein